MSLPNLYDSPLPFSKPCLVCKNEVLSEKNEYQNPVTGRILTWYTPISKYWTDEGVFCSCECGFLYSQGKIAKP